MNDPRTTLMDAVHAEVEAERIHQQANEALAALEDRLSHTWTDVEVARMQTRMALDAVKNELFEVICVSDLARDVLMLAELANEIAADVETIAYGFLTDETHEQYMTAERILENTYSDLRGVIADLSERLAEAAPEKVTTIENVGTAEVTRSNSRTQWDKDLPRVVLDTIMVDKETGEIIPETESEKLLKVWNLGAPRTTTLRQRGIDPDEFCHVEPGRLKLKVGRMTAEMDTAHAAALREPFPASAIGKIPKGGAQLDYVGHAAVTDRLLAVDYQWTWEPYATAEDGGPLIRNDGKTATMWIRLTVCGVTRPGVGSVLSSAGELEKQLISDAIRNAAMRFGVALDLWSKEDLGDSVPEVEAVVAPARPKPAKKERIDRLIEKVTALPEPLQVEFTRWKDDQGFPWPWPVKACDTIEIELVKLAAKPVEVPLDLEESF